MKETLAVASWAALLLSDLGQSHLLLGKSHVQKNGASGCESERGGGGGGGLVVGMGGVWRGKRGESEEEMDGGGRRDVRQRRVERVFYGAIAGTERQKSGIEV
ncbi:unnamed protein product [Pleuronectes platessa]|uniref:Secreted protein n=1 Tax=Pleuronectes platessa TaxID=8262 RepID=A0A9N7ZAU9_PLEPL|nr:unnamed protein product [Pleuronectes platessa]